jgi:hypothetical protein
MLAALLLCYECSFVIVTSILHTDGCVQAGAQGAVSTALHTLTLALLLWQSGCATHTATVILQRSH